MVETASSFLPEVLSAYGAGTRDTVVVPLGEGRINDTFLVHQGAKRWVLQRLNESVFPRPKDVAENFHQVTEHLLKTAQAEQIAFTCPRLIATRSGKAAFQDQEGGWWRAQSYVEHVPVEDIHFGQAHAGQLGKMLALFHLLTENLPSSSLNDPLPGFHITPDYLRVYDSLAPGYTDRLDGSSEQIEQCYGFIDRFRSKAHVLERAKMSGELAVQVMHGDPKLDNVIFQGDGQAIGMFDLDTVSPGLVLYDIGDCLRSLCNTGGEGATEPAGVGFDLDRCARFLQGYLAVYEERLGAAKYYIYDAVLVLAFELGLRFFSDHLSGDSYFKVRRRGENLQRALVQFSLAAAISDQQKEIEHLLGVQ